MNPNRHAASTKLGASRQNRLLVAFMCVVFAAFSLPMLFHTDVAYADENALYTDTATVTKTTDDEGNETETVTCDNSPSLDGHTHTCDCDDDDGNDDCGDNDDGNDDCGDNDDGDNDDNCDVADEHCEDPDEDPEDTHNICNDTNGDGVCESEEDDCTCTWTRTRTACHAVLLGMELACPFVKPEKQDVLHAFTSSARELLNQWDAACTCSSCACKN